MKPPHGVVFGSPGRNALRDPTNAARDLRTASELLKLPWAPTFHTFRKTGLSKMEEAGFTPREAADQAGHSKPSMTQDVYFGRAVTVARAATALGRVR
ncbi:MAG: integrase family protein [Jatrophihabitans sp.]|nr:integrase family protein [Jatrophihabitans sp.]